MKTARFEAEVIDLGVYRRTEAGSTFAPRPAPAGVITVTPLVPLNMTGHPDYAMGFNDAQRGTSMTAGASAPYRAGHKAFWVARGILQHASPQAEVFYSTSPVPVPALADRPAEDLTAEGIQLVIPGTERRMPAGRKQMELF